MPHRLIEQPKPGQVRIVTIKRVQWLKTLQDPGMTSSNAPADSASTFSSCSLPATNPPLFSRLLQLPIPLRMDLLLTPGEHVLRRDVADVTVQANVVVMLDIAIHQSPCIVQRQWRSRPDALPLSDLCQRSIFPFD
jgi:hypothetical protein